VLCGFETVFFIMKFLSCSFKFMWIMTCLVVGFMTVLWLFVLIKVVHFTFFSIVVVFLLFEGRCFLAFLSTSVIFCCFLFHLLSFKFTSTFYEGKLLLILLSCIFLYRLSMLWHIVTEKLTESDYVCWVETGGSGEANPPAVQFRDNYVIWTVVFE